MPQTYNGKARRNFRESDVSEQTSVSRSRSSTFDALKMRAIHEQERNRLDRATFFPSYEELEAGSSAPKDSLAMVAPAYSPDMSGISPRLAVDSYASTAPPLIAHTSGYRRSLDNAMRGKRRDVPDIRSLLVQASLLQHITDKGRVIPRRHWTQAPEVNGMDPERVAELARGLMEQERRADPRFNCVIEVDEATVEYNCYSFVFTKGRGGCLTATDAKNILEDNQFRLVASYDGIQQRRDSQATIQKGDVVVCYTHFDARKPIKEPPHVGVFDEVKDNQIWIISKWGAFGLNKHPIDVLPREYGQQWAIFHTDRPGGRFAQVDASNT